MRILFAPMEGVAHYVYRAAQAACFLPADEYFIPFISPGGGPFSHRERQDVLPENNPGVRAVPQILANNADSFLRAAWELRALGYGEVNLNLGCPSATVVNKKKGAGLLGDPEMLDGFLRRIYADCPIEISIKTRLGMKDPREFDDLLAIFNRYPVLRLIVHPRVREDFYQGEPRMEGFEKALLTSRAPVCYNGDLWNGERVAAFQARYPEAESVMCGRGFLLHPDLVNQVRGQPAPMPQSLRAFHERLYADYQRTLGQPAFVLCKMKEVWSSLGAGQGLSPKAMKAIRKAGSYAAYEEAVSAAFEELEKRAV